MFDGTAASESEREGASERETEKIAIGVCITFTFIEIYFQNAVINIKQTNGLYVHAILWCRLFFVSPFFCSVLLCFVLAFARSFPALTIAMCHCFFSPRNYMFAFHRRER